MSRRAGKDPSQTWGTVVSKLKNHDKAKKEVDTILELLHKIRDGGGGKKGEVNPKNAEALKRGYVDALAAVKRQQSLLIAAQESLAYCVSSAEIPGQVVTADQPLGSQDSQERRKKFDISQPLKVIKAIPVPPLCGPTPPMPNFIIPTDSLVAARPEMDGEWILAVVTKIINKGKAYEVVDLDETNETSRHQVSPKWIVPLPTSLPDPKLRIEFAEKHSVLALYPETTCFYRAVVVEPPSKNKDGMYVVEFEDEDEQEGVGIPKFSITPRLVLAAPSMKK